MQANVCLKQIKKLLSAHADGTDKKNGGVNQMKLACSIQSE